MQTEPLKVQVAIHCYVPKEPECEMAWEIEKNRWPKEGEPGFMELYAPDVPRDGLLERLRGQLCSEASTAGMDVLIWIDHDIAWRTGDVLGLARKCAEVKGTVGGFFPYRDRCMRGKGFPVRQLAGSPPINFGFLGRDVLHEVEYVSGGFVAFWVPAIAATIEKLRDHTNPNLCVRRCEGGGEMTWHDICRTVNVPSLSGKDGIWTHLSEDWALIWRMHEAVGAKCYAWMKPLLRHVGKYAFSVADALGLPGTANEVEAEFLRLAAMPEREATLRLQLLHALGDPEFFGPAALAIRDALKAVEAKERAGAGA